MKDFLLIYDIFDPKRLSKVRKLAYSYSTGGQKSARETPLTKSQLMTLHYNIAKLIMPEDKVSILRVSKPILLGKATHLSYHPNGVILL